MSGEELAQLLHTDKTKISKWENEVDPIGRTTDRLLRLLAVTLDSEHSAHSASVARNFLNISDQSGEDQEIHINAKTLVFTFSRYRTAA